jgi:hypothetical protein
MPWHNQSNYEASNTSNPENLDQAMLAVVMVVKMAEPDLELNVVARPNAALIDKCRV